MDALQYGQVIASVVSMTDWNSPAQALAANHGGAFYQVTWEDAARFDFQILGPNSSDATVAVELANAKTGITRTFEVPVFRTDNFVDVTAQRRTTDVEINVGAAPRPPWKTRATLPS